MNGTDRPRNISRSIGAVLAGLLISIVLTLVTDVMLHLIHVFPAWNQPVSSPPLVLATVYRIIYGIFGGYITARLAPVRPMLHAMIPGALGFVVSIFGAVATWNKGAAYGPHWYPIALIVIALPCAWAGGKFRLRQLNS
jgi:hypothetical protein